MSIYLVLKYVIEPAGNLDPKNRMVIQKLTSEQEISLAKLLRFVKEISAFAKSKGWKSKDPPLKFYLDNPNQFFAMPHKTQPGYIINTHYLRVPLFVGLNFSSLPDAIIYPNIYRRQTYNFTKNLLEHQVPMVMEALTQLKRYQTTTLGVYTGAGKTVMAAWLAVHLERTVVIVVHRSTLPKQWESTFATFTNAKVCIFGEKNYTVEDFKESNVIICMNTRIVELSKYFNPGLMIIDEADCLCTTSNKEALLSFNPQYIIACTATLKRPDGMEKMIHALCGSHGVFKASTKPFTVIKIETGLTIPDEFDTYAKLKDFLHTYPPLKELIFNIVMLNLPHKFLILTRSIQFTKDLYEMFASRGIRTDWMASTKKSYHDSDVLIGTMEKIGTGFDESAFCADFNGVRMDYLIMADTIKSTQKTEQSVGRVLRAACPVVFDIVHAHRILKSHFNERRKWYTSRNATIKIHKLKIETATQEQYINMESQAVPISVIEAEVKYHPDYLDIDLLPDLPLKDDPSGQIGELLTTASV